MSAALTVECVHVQIVWLGNRCLCHGPSCQDTLGDSEKRCLSALIFDNKGRGQGSLACLKVLSLLQWQNKTEPLHYAKLQWTTTTTSSITSILSTSFPSFLSLFVTQLWRSYLGSNSRGKVFTPVNFNVCGSPLKHLWHKSLKGSFLCAKILMKLAVLSSS